MFKLIHKPPTVLLATWATIISFAMIGANLPAQSAGMDEVTVTTRTGPFVWTVELASDDPSRTKGLMFRRAMDAGAGMLFRFDQTRPVAMWMKNTFISLDMVFANEEGKVTHIHRGAVPQSLDIIRSQGPARYVLEVNAGEANSTGLQIGDQLKHPWFVVAK